MKYIILSVFQETLKKDEYATNIINYLCAMLPTMLNIFHNIEYDRDVIRVALARERYEELLDKFILTLKKLKFPNIRQVKKLLKFNPKNIQHNEALYTELVQIFKKNSKLLKSLSPDSLKDVNKVLLLYKTQQLLERHWNTIRELSKSIENEQIKKFIRSLENIGTDASKEKLQTAKESCERLAKKYFGTKNPTDEQQKELKETNPEKYKEYRKLVTLMKKASKTLLEDAWQEEPNFQEIENVQQVKKLLKKLDIPDPIDAGFVGKVALGPTPATMFRYFTKFGKELENVPGSGIKMNPNYTKEDNTFYCIGFPQQNFTNNVFRFYTKDWRRRSLASKHAKARKLATELNIDELRKAYFQDLKSVTSSKHLLTPKALAALVTAVIDDTAGRIGNSESEKKGVYGIHNLLGEHLTIKNDKAILSYNGKKNVHQEHIITNPKIVKALAYLKSIRKKKEYLFSVTGEHPLRDSYINKYLTALGFPDTAHGFRKFHANRIFNEIIKEYKKEIKERPLEIFNLAVDEVAKKLGHQPINSIKSYIDSDLIRNYFDHAKIEPPKTVKKVLDSMREENA